MDPEFMVFETRDEIEAFLTFLLGPGGPEIINQDPEEDQP